MEKVYNKLVGKRTEQISRIEARTKDDVIKLLKWNGIGGIRSHRFHDYGLAKKLCFEGLVINSEIYDTQIGWISDFLKL